MRNSLFPILMMLAVAGAVVALLVAGSHFDLTGRDGPIVAPGIFRLPRGARGDIPSMQGLTIEDKVGVVSMQDDRVGLEPDPWTTVVVGADDREPVTRAAVLAVAEDLTRRGVVVIIDAPEAHSLPPPLPLPADRWLRFRTERADEIPQTPGDPFHAVVRVRHGGARLPADHPAAGLQWAGGTRELTFTVDHRSSLRDGRERAWPRWWAAVGRAIARDALATIEPEIAPGAPLPGDWTRRARPQWPDRVPDPPNESSVGDSAASPFAQGLPVARWFACFQHDLVRGWIGRIDGTTTIDDAGKNVSSFAPVEHRLDQGEWKLASAADAPTRIWKHERDGKTLWFSAKGTGDGWQLACWQEWKQPAGVHDDWLDAAKAGDVAARDKLRRHLLSKALPPDQQEAARALLAKGDLAERVMAVDDGYSHLVEQIAGRAAPVAYDGTPPVLTRGAPVEAPIGPDFRVAMLGTSQVRILWLVSPLRSDDEFAKDSAGVVGGAAPGVAFVQASGARVSLAAGADQAVADALAKKLDERGAMKTAAFATAAGATVSIPLPDGALEATCRDGKMTLVWK